TIFSRDLSSDVCSSDLYNVVKSMAAKAKTFATLLSRLAKAGIPAGLIQEVAGYGTEQGSEVARAILSGSSTQIKQLAADFSNLRSEERRVGQGATAGSR